ncbi:MAG: recombination regulator RecX [Olsenella sp.]|nr:recombination regulator RecX [Olsenella sp.]
MRTPQRGEERMSVPVAVARCLDSKARGRDLLPSSRAELLYAMGEASRKCAMERAAALVDRRDYSEEELSARLKRDGYAPQTVEYTCRRSVECGLVDNARFADAFIRSKLSQGWGRVRIERELSRRGVDTADVPGWPDLYLTQESEEETAYELASRRRLTGKHDYEKLVRFLSTRGFPLGLATRTARRVIDEERDSEDF